MPLFQSKGTLSVEQSFKERSSVHGVTKSKTPAFDYFEGLKKKTNTD
jgi:hypothetical protein